MATEFNILLAGVGGQGVILMSELLGQAAIADGLSVRGSEVLGMAVRGGPVTSMIRIGNGAHGPLIPQGRCHVLVALEPAEALRHVSYLSTTGLTILNTAAVVPFTVTLGQSDYPCLEEVLEKLRGVAGKVIALDAARIAQEAGSILATNIVMLGALFGVEMLPIKLPTMRKAIEARFPPKAALVNVRAFELGYDASRQAAQ